VIKLWSWRTITTESELGGFLRFLQWIPENSPIAIRVNDHPALQSWNAKGVIQLWSEQWLKMRTNPIILIHDHGAERTFELLSEFGETTGGPSFDKLPVGDPEPFLPKEIVGNESQERMELVKIAKKRRGNLASNLDRERAPFMWWARRREDMHFKFENSKTGQKAVDWNLAYIVWLRRQKTVLRGPNQPCGFREATRFWIDPRLIPRSYCKTGSGRLARTVDQ